MLFVGLLASTCTAMAGKPPSAPMLRIEPQGHTDGITRMATDADGMILVTSSFFDKTVRLWDVGTGALLQTLRVPMGDGNEGKILGVAISPDGRRVAAAGVTGTAWDGEASVYVFDRVSGRMESRLPGGAGTITSLAWSPDGRWIAVGADPKKLRIYASDTYRLSDESADFSGDAAGLDWSRDGMLALASSQGMLRLFRVSDGKLVRVAGAQAPGGFMPSTIRFAPDGRRLAIGYIEARRSGCVGSCQRRLVEVRSGTTLVVEALPDASEPTTNENRYDYIHLVAWSECGESLFGAGHMVGPRGLLRIWSKSGQGSYAQVEVDEGHVGSLLPLSGGRLAVGMEGGDWGVLDRSGKRQLWSGRALADLGGSGEALRVSAEGDQIRFGFAAMGQDGARFSVTDRRFLPDPEGGNLAQPSFEARRFLLDIIQDQLRKRDVRLFAASRDDSGFVIPGSGRLDRYDKLGTRLWSVKTSSTIHGLNVTPSGRYVVVAYGDGTIRWHRYQDGGEVLAFFPHNDRRRWVLWTPSGYFDASPGGVDLIGWQVNRGAGEAPDFFPASRFSGRFYRPDVIDRVLEAGDEQTALKRADDSAGRKPVASATLDQILPPVVEIVSFEVGDSAASAYADGPGSRRGATPKSGSDAAARRALVVNYRVRTQPGSPASEIQARVNNAFAGVFPLDQKADPLSQRSLRLHISRVESEVALFAKNRHGQSQAVVVRVPGDAARQHGRLYVLAVGITKYRDPSANLGFAAKDATDFVQLMRRQEGLLYERVEARVLTDALATRAAVVEGLEWLRDSVREGDLGVLYLAGHGVNERASGRYAFAAHDVDMKRPRESGVGFESIRDSLALLKGKAIAFIDTCHAGNIFDAKRFSLPESIRLSNELSLKEYGIVVFASSGRNELSHEDPAWGNGAFTKMVLEGLRGGAARRGSDEVTHAGLWEFVSVEVPRLTHGKQNPVYIAPHGERNYPLARLKQ